MSSYEGTPIWVYLFSLILAVPLTWLAVGLVADDAPGFVVMAASIVLTVVIAGLLNRVRRPGDKR